MGGRPENLKPVSNKTVFRVAIVTMDTHLNSAALKAKLTLQKDIPGQH